MKNLIITARLAHDAEVKQLPSGSHVLEVAAYATDKKGDDHIIKLVQFSKEAPKNSHLFKKGNLVSASGTNKIEAYINKAGEAVATETLTVDNLHLEQSTEANRAPKNEEA